MRNLKTINIWKKWSDLSVVPNSPSSISLGSHLTVLGTSYARGCTSIRVSHISMSFAVARSRQQRYSLSTRSWESRRNTTSQKFWESYFRVRAICHYDKWLSFNTYTTNWQSVFYISKRSQNLCIMQLCIYAFAILNCIKIIQNAYNI